MLNPFKKTYSKEKLLLAFEYGMLLAKTAQDMKIDLTTEIAQSAEIMLENEFTNETAEHLAMPNVMIPNIMSAFELNLED